MSLEVHGLAETPTGSGNAMGPLRSGEFLLHQLSGSRELVVGVVATTGGVARLEVLQEGADDLVTGQTGLRTQRVDTLVC